MPKIKTHSGASKRFKVSANGKLMRKHTSMRHMMRKKTTKQKRHLAGSGVVKDCDSGQVILMLGTRTSRLNRKKVYAQKLTQAAATN